MTYLFSICTKIFLLLFFYQNTLSTRRAIQHSIPLSSGCLHGFCVAYNVRCFNTAGVRVYYMVSARVGKKKIRLKIIPSTAKSFQPTPATCLFFF